MESASRTMPPVPDISNSVIVLSGAAILRAERPAAIRVRAAARGMVSERPGPAVYEPSAESSCLFLIILVSSSHHDRFHF